MNDATPREATAYHEAAHAVFNCRFGIPFTKAYIRECPDGQWRGRVEGLPDGKHWSDYSDSMLNDRIMMFLAGLAAERILADEQGPLPECLQHDPLWKKAEEEWFSARDACEIGLRRNASPTLRGMLKETQELLSRDEIWHCVEDVAQRLNEATELDAAEIHAIYRKHFPDADPLPE